MWAVEWLAAVSAVGRWWGGASEGVLGQGPPNPGLWLTPFLTG